MKNAFTLIDILLTGAVLAAIAGAVIPSYRLYQIRSDLNIAVEQTKQMLGRARLKSQTGDQSSQWGVAAGEGTLFLGTGFTLRDPGFDEVFPLPPGISVSGLTEVYFSMLYGLPDQTGDIVFTASNGDQRRLTVAADDMLSGPPLPPVRIKVRFDRIKNSGSGSAENKLFVGSDATPYEEGEWISLTADTAVIVDGGIVLGVNGLSVQREEGFVRIVAYGGLDSGGKEIVDATVMIDNGTIDRIENEAGEHEGEKPFDGSENEGVGGDEYILAPDKLSVEFKTRVTNAGDTILIFWESSNP